MLDVITTIFVIALAVAAVALLGLAVYLYTPQLRARRSERRHFLYLQDSFIRNWGADRGAELLAAAAAGRTQYWSDKRDQRFAALLAR